MSHSRAGEGIINVVISRNTEVNVTEKFSVRNYIKRIWAFIVIYIYRAKIAVGILYSKA